MKTGADVSGTYQGQSAIDFLSNLISKQEVQEGQVKEKTAETQTSYMENLVALAQQIFDEKNKKAGKFGKIMGAVKLFSRALDPTGTVAAVIGDG